MTDDLHKDHCTGRYIYLRFYQKIHWGPPELMSKPQNTTDLLYITNICVYQEDPSVFIHTFAILPSVHFSYQLGYK